MADSDDFRIPNFTTSRRGYDRAEVDGFVQQMRAKVESLEAEVASLNRKVAELGGPQGDDLRSELTAVSRDVDQILQAAREAADKMRTRAAEDASKWRGAADDDCRVMRDEAETQAFQLRKAAWESSTEMIDQVSSASADAIRLAEQDALFIRAEAEREALRLTGDARRDIEEELRAAKAEAERAIANARAESEAILETARQSAEAAQERARALEERRAELMGELESARSSIDQLESEIDTRRHAIHNAGMGETGVTVVLPEPAAPPMESSDPLEEGWIDEDASVRIVRPDAAPPVMAQPTALVDADELVAEVLQLREAQEHRDAAVEVEASHLEEAVDSTGGATDQRDAGEDPVTEDSLDGPDVDTSVDHGESESSEDAEIPAETPSDTDDGPPTATPQPDGALDELFASLRSTDDRPDSAAEVTAPQPPSPAQEVPAEEPQGAETGDHESESIAEAVVPIELSVDPFELRERLLLPIENRALRGVKRTIVGLQNRVLEDLRLAGDDWSPEPVMFTATFESEIETLTNEAVVAGYAGAGEMLDLGAIPHPKGGRPTDQTAPFVKKLVEAVAEARASAAASGGSARQQAAAISRVFRAWRTDEAGRRLRDAAYSAYHEGLIRALGSAGVGTVSAMPRGRSHADCPAVKSGPWDPVRAVAGSVVVPPASAGCECTVVPAGNSR
ncbi:MAG: hypothetical protein HKN07_13495 [Acidimicrobiia bacterium]|nr:hypothetical protein [Acidimicrobiia bacterium]